MKNRYHAFALVCLAVLNASLTFAFDKKTEATWKKTGLSFELLENYLKTHCYDSTEAFIACTQSINEILVNLEPISGLVPKEYFKKNPNEFRSLEKNFNSLVLVKLKKVKTLATIDRAIWERAKSAQIQVSFQNLLDIARNKITQSAQSHESQLAASSLDAFLKYFLNDPYARIAPNLNEPIEPSTNTEPAREEYYGIGAILDLFQNKLRVLSPLPGSPALKHGIRTGDLITHVDGKSVRGQSLEDLVPVIRGPKGTSLTLRIQRGSMQFDLTLTREPISTNIVQTRILNDHSNKLGYIKLETFDHTEACNKVSAALKSLTEENVTGLILDLRDNLGGLIDQATCITNLFLPQGLAILHTKKILNSLIETEEGKQERADVVKDHYFSSVEPLTQLPLVVLINAGSASASEILAGALQHHRRAFIVGERSFGKGTVQLSGTLKENNKITLWQTVAYFYLPNLKTTHIYGVLPDFFAYRKPNPSKQDMKALRAEDLFSIKIPMPADATPPEQHTPFLVSELAECVKTTGKAKELYAKHLRDPIAPDYPLFYAEDVSKCMLTLEPLLKELEEIKNKFKQQKRTSEK